MPRFLMLALAGLCLLGTGCLEISQEYTINPDGSGKVTLEQISPPPPSDKAPNPEELAKGAISERVRKAQGVEAWESVSAEMTKEGKVRFRGVAYFADINKLDLEGNGQSPVKWNKGTLQFESKIGPGGGGPDEPEKKLTDAEITEQVTKKRAEYQQGKQFMAAILTGMKIKMTFNLPGDITASNVFAKEGKKAVLSMTGEQMMAAMDKVNGDDALMRRSVSSKKANDEVMQEAMFGAKGEPSATVGGAQAAQFDYKADAAKAKAAQADMFKKLGVEAPAN